MRDCLVKYGNYLGLIWLLSSPISVDAAIVWDHREVTVSAKPDDESIQFYFPFTVEARRVSFLATEIPCGCADAAADKASYQPGEKGVYSVRLMVEDRVGEQEVEVPVRINDGTEREEGSLILRANIPQLIQVSKKLMIWDAKTKSAPQTITFSAVAPYKITSVRAISSHKSAAVKVDGPDARGQFSIEVSLLEADYRKPIKIDIQTDLPVKRQSAVVIWALNRLPE